MSKIKTNTKIFIVPGETRLIKQFDELEFDYAVEPMDVGDIQIRVPDEDGNWTKIAAVIERKEGKDLNSSIKDGRYEEQKSLIVSLFATSNLTPDKVYYLVENFPSPSVKGFGLDSQARKCMWSAITNTMYRDGFHVFQSKTHAESVEFLNSLKNSISKWFTGKTDGDTNELRVHEAALKKKKVSPEDFLKHSLMLIKGIQDDIADAIVAKYPTFAKLIDKYSRMIDNDQDPAKLFANYLRASGARKIGPVMSAKIWEFIKPNL